MPLQLSKRGDGLPYPLPVESVLAQFESQQGRSDVHADTVNLGCEGEDASVGLFLAQGLL